MNHLKALGIKFLIQTTVILSFLSIFDGASLTNLLSFSLITTIFSYVIGDLFILPKFGHVVASIADFGLISFVVWILADMFFQAPIIAPLTVGLIIAVAEILFHTYMKEKVLRKKATGNKVIPFPASRRLQTEFAEENDVHGERDQKE